MRKKKEENTQQQQNKNLDYYDEHGKSRYEDIINYENEIRKEIEETTPLISDLKSTSDKKNLKIQNIVFPIDINNSRELLINYFLIKKGNYLIVFVILFISSYLLENRII